METADIYVPIVVDHHVKIDCRKLMYKLMKSERDIGFTKISGDYSFYLFRLASHGPNPAINLLWKSKKGDKRCTEEDTKAAVYLYMKTKNDIIVGRREE